MDKKKSTVTDQVKEVEVKEAVVEAAPQEAPAKVMLVSKVNYPVILEYGDDKMRLSPYQKVKVDPTKLKTLPTGVVKITV